MEKRFTVTSPSMNTAITVSLSKCGGLTYFAAQDGITVIEESAMGITTGAGDFTCGLVFESETDTAINETYPMLSGKRKIYTNRCNEKTIRFDKSGVKFDLVLRAYDDGIAFRYIITTSDTQAMTVEPNAEITNFRLPDRANIWFMPRRGRDFMYEDNYLLGKIGETEDGIQPSLPMLYETKGKYGLIMEADRHGTYTGSLLRLENGSTMQMIFDLVQTAPVQTSAPFVSPWRCVIIGTPADILQNTMVQNLSPAPDPAYEFDKWVEPGLSSWSWVSYYGGQEDPDIHRKFIDLAADMGWKYYILDERWQPECKSKPGIRYEGMWPWFDKVKAHADEKGVKLLAWVNKTDVAVKEERLARFKEWSEAGIVGIKVDFFFNDSQEMMQLYDDIYRDAAQYKLLVNAHGSNPPSGEIRTYPNAIAREAIRGQEQGGITCEQYTLIPFLRSAVGTADVTEQLYSRDVRKTSMGFQIALSVLIENGIHSMGSKPEEYYSVPAAVNLYTNFPESWDDLAVIDTDVGVKVNLARKSGETWLAGGISVDEHIFAYKPTFLDSDKTYTAIVYCEKSGERQALDMRVMNNVTRDTAISVDVQRGGGYVIKFVPSGASDLKSVTANVTDVTVETYYTIPVSLAYDPVNTTSAGVIWSVADPAVASVEFTAKGAFIKGLSGGKTVVTAASIYDEAKKAKINVTVLPPKYVLDGKWTVKNSDGKYIIKGENEVTITAKTGIIESDVFAMKVDGDFEITASVSGSLNANWQGGFIGAFSEDLTKFVSIGKRYHTSFRSDSETRHNHIAMMCGNKNIERYTADPNPFDYTAVRLVKSGSTFTGSFMKDGAWTAFPDGVIENPELAAGTLYVGFWTGCGGSNNSVDITVRDFAVNGTACNPADENK